MNTTLYDDLKAARCELDHHESDLYVRDTPEARAVILKHAPVMSMATFRGTDGLAWIEIPFAYTPFWQRRGCTAS